MVNPREVENALRDAGVSMYRLEARLLCEFAAAGGGDLDALLSRRLVGEPIAYITGEWEFYSLPLKVTRDTLIPRSDTETLAERAIELLRGVEAPRVLDLCAGTGCIGLAIAVNVKGAEVVFGELSDAALAVCRENIRLNAKLENVDACRLMALSMSALEAPPQEFIGAFDLIVSNPPYIPSAELAGLDVSVREFEPRLALDGAEDGLRFYRAIAERWKRALKPRGRLVFEVGCDQSTAVQEILRQNGYENIAVTRDLNKIERVIEGENANG